MNKLQFNKMHIDKGFIAALDQSGGSTPKALKLYGISEDKYQNEAEMFDLVHQMRTRIITSPAFQSEQILGAILFEQTMDREIGGKYTADYLWEEKEIVPFLKIDRGLEEESRGVQLMKPIPDLDLLLERAVKRNIFGTKMRSVIKEANREGIRQVVKQQFQLGIQIAEAGLVPILEPEVDIYSKDKAEAEEILKDEILKYMESLNKYVKIMFKFSIPSIHGFYSDLMEHPQVVRVVALSGGYNQQEANERLKTNPGLIASFSRALSEGLSYQQNDEEFNAMLKDSVNKIYEASIS